MQFLLTALNWFVYSSKDKNKVSLTLKSAAPLAVFVAMLFGVNTDEKEVNTIFDLFVDVIAGAGALVSACTMLWGFIRKFLPKKPENP